MADYKERKQRFFEEVEDLDSLYTLLNEKFLHKKLDIKYDVDLRKATINEIDLEKKLLMLVTDEDYEPSTKDMIMLSGLVDRYFEIDFHVEKKVGPGYFRCSIKAGRKATTGRADLRFKINNGDAVATNFNVSKYTIDLNMFSLPTTIKVILDQFEAANKDSADIFSIGYFDGKDALLNEIKKSGNTFWVENMVDLESYTPINDTFIDLNQIYGYDTKKYLSQSRDKGYKSIIIVPIIYITDSESAVPFAYIRKISKTVTYSFEDVFQVKDESFKLVERIREANTVSLSAKQDIVDISKGGLRLKIENDELKRYFMKAKGFVFDIVFRLQQPITIYGEIKFTGVDPEKNLILGLSFSGNTSRKNQMKHLFEILEPMEVEYKRRLIAQMKMKQK
ncbi:MAG: DUF1577 domain-containing protein [Spirochaetes bacterium]|nr:DUF1577 domain-containing protein [Spirochaetota bacterium]